MLLLLAEDDPKIAKLILRLLQKEGHRVDHASTGEEALMFVEMNQYELIILDWMMPGMSGIDVCKKLRQHHYEGGILMLTAKDDLDDKVIGLEAGADDYLIKPFEYRELSARIIALGRRSNRQIQSKQVTKGVFSIDTVMKVAYYKGENMALTSREFQLFQLLFDYNGAAVPRDLILSRVWGMDGDITDNNLDAFIRLLRKKLKAFDKRPLIVNKRGIGYRLEVYDV